MHNLFLFIVASCLMAGCSSGNVSEPDNSNNQAPLVEAGDDQLLDVPANQIATMKGSANDDGIPGNDLSFQWSKVSGPGTVEFSDENSPQTFATITTAGSYVLRLSVNDGDLTGTDEVNIQVHDSGRLTYPIIITDIPKATADMSNFTKSYTIDLEAFGIYNDGTHPSETSAGINAALQHIKTLDPVPNLIIFPPGTYLISELEPIIFDHQDTIVDLNGAILQKNPNGLDDTHMVILAGVKNFRLTNGTLTGDRDSHDYETIESSHEHNRLLTFEYGYNIEVDRITVRDGSGFAISTRTGMAQTTSEGQYTYVYTNNIEQGAFSDTGEKIDSTTKIRSNQAYDLEKYLEDQEFEFGYSMGYQGLAYINEREFQAYFYDTEMGFISKKDCLQFKKISIPSGAQFVHLEFNQSPVPETEYIGRLTDMEPPEHVHFHHNWIYNNRGLGLAFCGGQKWILENNLFEENGIDGTPPAYAVDFEDGWDLMQDIVFRKNEFVNNNGDLVVCAGSEMIFEDNSLQAGYIFLPRCENYIIRQNIIIGDEVNDHDRPMGGFASYGTKTGHLSIHDNVYQNANLEFDNFIPGKPLIVLENDSLYNIMTIYGKEGYELLNCLAEWARWLISDAITSAKFEGCTFVGQEVGLHFYEDGPPVTVTEINNSGTLDKYGPNLDRLQ
jgi:hypothetical protein